MQGVRLWALRAAAHSHSYLLHLRRCLSWDRYPAIMQVLARYCASYLPESVSISLQCILSLVPVHSSLQSLLEKGSHLSFEMGCLLVSFR